MQSYGMDVRGALYFYLGKLCNVIRHIHWTLNVHRFAGWLPGAVGICLVSKLRWCVLVRGFVRFPFIGLFDICGGWTKRERRTEEQNIYVCMQYAPLYEARVKFIFMAERMGCKDGKIVVICENFWQMVCLCGCLWCARVIVRVCVFVWICVGQHAQCPNVLSTAYPSRSTQSRTLAHFPMSTSSELFHENHVLLPLCCVKVKHPALCYSVISFAPVQSIKWDGNRIDCIGCDCVVVPPNIGWCEREPANASNKRDHTMMLQSVLRVRKSFVR